MNRIKDLRIRKDSIELAKQIYVLRTTDSPITKDFALLDQMQRAAVSIASNIAEGSARGSKIEFARYCRIARGSLVELETQLTIAKEICYIDNELYNNLWTSIDILHKQINSFIKSLTSLGE